MTAPLYTGEILKLAASLTGPHHLERIDGDAELRSPTCGSRVRTAVQLGKDHRIEAISQKVHACAFGQASAALLERNVVGRKQSEVKDALQNLTLWLEENERESGGWPGVEALSPARARRARHAAILLPFRTLLAAIQAAK